MKLYVPALAVGDTSKTMRTTGPEPTAMCRTGQVPQGREPSVASENVTPRFCGIAPPYRKKVKVSVREVFSITKFPPDSLGETTEELYKNLIPKPPAGWLLRNPTTTLIPVS